MDAHSVPELSGRGALRLGRCGTVKGRPLTRWSVLHSWCFVAAIPVSNRQQTDTWPQKGFRKSTLTPTCERNRRQTAGRQWDFGANNCGSSRQYRYLVAPTHANTGTRRGP